MSRIFCYGMLLFQDPVVVGTKLEGALVVAVEEENVQFAAVAAILAIAAAIFVFLQYSGMYNDKAKAYNDLVKERDALKSTVATLESNFGDILENGSMQITNGFSADVNIAWWSVTYRDKEGKIQKFDSFEDGHSLNGSKYEFPSYSLKAGQTQKMQHVSGNDVVWDGSVISYAVIVAPTNNNGTFYLFSGIWNRDAKDGKLYVSKPRYSN